MDGPVGTAGRLGDAAVPIRILARRLGGMASRYALVGLFCAALNIAIVWGGTELLGMAYPWP